jgi:two-component system chemotaxis response regulator CheB
VPYDLIVMGTSQGGLHALSTIVAGLPKNFRLPIAVVQHRSKDSDDVMISLLRECGSLPVREAEDKEMIESGWIYIAPPDYHLLVDGNAFALSTEAPVAYSRPSIDVLFESAAESYGERLVGVILTGANADGAKGLGRIKEFGGYAVVQDPATAESAPMPNAAIASVRVDRVLPLGRIAPFLVELMQF